MNKQSAYDQSLRSRIRAWFHPAEARLRSMYRLGYAAGQRAANVIPSTWRGDRPTDSAQVPLLPAPTVISGIAGGQHWDGEIGTWRAAYTHPVAPQEPKPTHLTSEQRQTVLSALATQPKKPEQLDTLLPERLRNSEPIAAVALVAVDPVASEPLTEHTGAFLLNDTSRDELFADVPQLGESLDDEEQKTVARQDPALYRIQQMARSKQKGA